MQCAYHPDKIAVLLCVRCLKDICEVCKTTVEGMVYCRSCADEMSASQKTKETAQHGSGLTLGKGLLTSDISRQKSLRRTWVLRLMGIALVFIVSVIIVRIVITGEYRDTLFFILVYIAVSLIILLALLTGRYRVSSRSGPFAGGSSDGGGNGGGDGGGG